MFEDQNLAFRLQDEEFSQHYALNRAQRQLVGRDVRHSRKEQETENRNARLLKQRELEAM